MEQISIYLSVGILGIMLFFSFVIAPVIFKSLDEKNARVFIRNIFPYYYSVNLGLCLIAIINYIYLGLIDLEFYLILIIGILFAISNFILMPLINKFRDTNQDNKFKYSHALSVIINLIQIVILIFLLIRN